MENYGKIFYITSVIFFSSLVLAQAAPIKYEPCCADMNRSAHGYAGKYIGPLIDTHTHLDGGTSKQYKQSIINLINDKALDGLLLMPTPNHGKMPNAAQSVHDSQKLSIQTKGKIKALCGADYINTWLNKKKTVSSRKLDKHIKKLDGQLEKNWCVGIGEIAIRHFEKWDGQLVLVVPFVSNGLQRLFSVAEGRGVPIDIHNEPMERNGKSWEEEWFTELDIIFSSYPNLTVILSHTGMTSASNVRKIIDSYPNVYFNVKLILNHKKWVNLEPVNTKRLRKGLYKDWAVLFEDHPDRFMIGSDYKFGRKGHGTKFGYEWYVEQYRKILGSLDPEVAEKIAHKNARRIYKFN